MVRCSSGRGCGTCRGPLKSLEPSTVGAGARLAGSRPPIWSNPTSATSTVIAARVLAIVCFCEGLSLIQTQLRAVPSTYSSATKGPSDVVVAR